MTTETTETTIAVEGETFTDAVVEAQEASSLQLIESGTALPETPAPLALDLEADAQRMAAIIQHEQSTPKSRAKAFDALDAIEAAKADTRRPRARKASSTTKARNAGLVPGTPEAEARAARQQAKAIRDADLAAQERKEQALSPTKKAPAAKKAAPAKASAAKAAPKRVMAEDAYGKYIQAQELAGHRVTTLAVERDADAAGKARYLTASYEVATLKGKVLGQLRFDHGSWFVVREDDETKVPSIGKGIAALAGK
jgi:hypothetical protein